MVSLVSAVVSTTFLIMMKIIDEVALIPLHHEE
jgi:hypothetical protein